MPSTTHRVHDLPDTWKLYLRTEELSTATIANYLRTLRLLTRWLDEQGHSGHLSDINHRHLQAFINDVRDRTSANSAGFHFRNLRALYAWLVREEHMVSRADDPMPDVRQPKVTDVARPPLSTEEAAAVLKACSGTSFDARRDSAIIRLFLDTGLRVGGLVGMSYDPAAMELDNKGRNDVFLSHNPPLIRLRLKGGRMHYVDLTPKTALALDRYVRARAAHRHASSPNLWLGQRGTFQVQAVALMLKRRAKQAGLTTNIHPHRFRRTMATWSLDGGQSRETVKRRGGWSSDQTLGLYVSDSEERRAWSESQRSKIADRV